MSTMREYVVRRARAEKRYKANAKAAGIGEAAWEWLKKLANGEISNPGADRIEILWRHYKALEVRGARRNGHARVG